MSEIPDRATALRSSELAPELLRDDGTVALIECALEELRDAIDVDAHLTAAERAAAARRPPRVARRFAASRAVQRFVLGRLVDRAPTSLEFGRGPHGKPYLPHDLGLDFNQADSDDLVLIGVRRRAPGPVPTVLQHELGVDLEHIRRWPDLEDIASEVFTEEENSWRVTASAAERERRFFRLWTAKEAFIKATGEGLYRPLLGFRVDLTPPALVHQITPRGGVAGPRVFELPSAKEWCASACALGPVEAWTRWRLSS